MYSALNLSGNGRSAIRPAESKQSGTQPPSPPHPLPPLSSAPDAPSPLQKGCCTGPNKRAQAHQTQAHSYTHARAHKHTYREHKIKVIVAGPARVISSKLLLLIIGSKQEEGAEGVPRRSRSSRSLMHLPPALASRRRGPARSQSYMCAQADVHAADTYILCTRYLHTYCIVDT